MAWWSRRRRRSAADESLARIEAERIEVERMQAEREKVVAPSAADAHMEEVMRRTGVILGDVPAAEQGRFMVVVASAEDGPAGTVVTAEQHEGAVGTGSTVAVMALPADAADMAQDDVLLGTRPLAATVVAFDAATGRLEIAGVAASDLTLGSMISR